ncbi:MAG: YabP/YqfC family sporulation protein [Faecalibacterium sp.]|nr:YabP/YqfC family sporulation protein [Faecalibacterium sp.]
MPKRNRRQAGRPHHTLKNLLAQPPAPLYEQPSLYWCGQEIEIEHFLRVTDFAPERIQVSTRKGTLTITGDALVLTALEKGRALIRGRFLKIEFSYQ